MRGAREAQIAALLEPDRDFTAAGDAGARWEDVYARELVARFGS